MQIANLPPPFPAVFTFPALLWSAPKLSNIINSFYGHHRRRNIQIKNRESFLCQSRNPAEGAVWQLLRVLAAFSRRRIKERGACHSPARRCTSKHCPRGGARGVSHAENGRAGRRGGRGARPNFPRFCGVAGSRYKCLSSRSSEQQTAWRHNLGRYEWIPMRVRVGGWVATGHVFPCCRFATRIN